jgi:hypothetical protein
LRGRTDRGRSAANPDLAIADARYAGSQRHVGDDIDDGTRPRARYDEPDLLVA